MKTQLLIFFITTPIFLFCQTDESSKTKERVTNLLTISPSEKKAADGTSFSNAQVGETNGSRSYMVDRYGNQYELNKAYYENKLVELDNHLIAIDQKIEYVNSNEEEKNKATQNGWFVDMENTKQRLQNERAELISKIASFE